MDVTIFGCELDEGAAFREHAPRFGITPTITMHPVSESTIALAAGRRCISVSHKTPVTDDHLDALAAVGVRYVSTRSVGYNHVNVDHATRIGITVENVAYSPDSVADHTLMLILMALRGARAAIARVDAHDYRLDPVRGTELRDLTVGVVGTGRIGSAVIDRLGGFGCRILASDSRSSASVSAEYVPLDELLERSDIVTLHVPLDGGTHHLLDASTLARLRSGAIVVNTARGSLIDTAALVDALESGRLGGAALDVVEGEDGVFYADRRSRHPDGLLARLHRLPSVLLTPHSAYYTGHALADTVESSLTNFLRFEREHDYA